MDNRIQQAIDFIQTNLHQPMNLQLLSDVACLSPTHFHRRFKLSTGCTPNDFVETHKIKKSLDLLLEPQESIQDIAYQLGFSNYETFSRSFSKRCRVAPGDLKAILSYLQQHTDPEAPLVVCGSSEMDDLVFLVEEALQKDTFSELRLGDLQLCHFSFNALASRSRKIESKYHISLQPDLSKQLVETLQEREIISL